jgi:hypothetical protein
MLTDDTRHECERLVLMGRETFGPPSPRQMLVARTLDPGSWSDHAQEQVDWSVRHGRTHWSDNFGAQFLILRRLALMRATEILRRLDRQAAGRRELPTLDALALGRTLEKRMTAIRTTDHRRQVSHKAVRIVSFLRIADGVPAPKATMGEDGSVSLVWSERGRSARVSIDAEGAVLLSLSAWDGDRVPLDPMSWSERPWRLIATATDWVHYDGPLPDPHERNIRPVMAD